MLRAAVAGSCGKTELSNQFWFWKRDVLGASHYLVLPSCGGKENVLF